MHVHRISRMEEQEELLGGKGAGIRVSTFDYSVENHFKEMDMISKLCGEAETDSVDETEIQCFKSSITFLSEWKHYKYDLRIIRFASETDNSQQKCVLGGIKLPQFSSATVPKERPDGGAPSLEYRYKLDLPWFSFAACFVLVDCVANFFDILDEEAPPMKNSKLGARNNRSKMDNSVELNRLKRRPRKKTIEESSSNEATKALVKMPKGRPRKRPREESPSNEAMAEISSKRPKGRPRKKPIEESPSNEATKEILALVNEATKENLDSPGLLAIEGISQNILDEAKHKHKLKEQKTSTKKLSNCNSNLKTTAQSRRLKSKARKGSNYDGVACPLLLTHNEDDNVSLDINSTSTVNYQTHENSGLNTAMPPYGSDNVSLDINSTSSIPKDADLPGVVLCLPHNGKVAWDVKWRPCNAPHSKYQHRMGYLAVLLGNRSLEVWDVPLPYAMKSVCSSSNGEGADPHFVKLKPVFRCSTLKCGGIQSLETPFRRNSDLESSLSHGCFVEILCKWCVVRGASDTRPLLCFSSDTVTIRAITWVPSESDSFRPLWDLHPAPKLIYSLDWLPDPRCIILSFDDTMRRLSLAKAANDTAVNGQPSVGPKQLGMHFFNCSSFAIWSIQLSRLTGTLVLSFALVLK
ncbi:hypothetical protein POTOM_022517 [Populus tomentosa]|uniref:Transducin/WD40 repeat-like superfamily protein n=1 Tax=Populus tomentosa TaxID=118781 RepID=A0A8X8CYL3_POPTO|nr:hypothetical protein POTOM_022517 [Populus tomentosa]